MAYLNGLFIGYSPLLGEENIPPTSTFTKVTLYGGQSVFDKLHIQNIELTNAQISAIDPFATVAWNPKTILLANFDADTLDGGNVIALPSALVGWKIYRTDTSTNISTLIATVLAGTSTYTDFGVAAYKTYSYELIPYTATAQGSPLVTDDVYSDFFGYYILNYDGTGNVYKFDLELQSGEYQNNEDFVEYQTYTGYNAYAIGKRKFFSTSVSAIAGEIDVNGSLVQSSDYLIELRDFIQNGKLKYFKDRKGNIMVGLTHNYRQKVLLDAIQQQPYVISFDFVETQAV